MGETSSRLGTKRRVDMTIDELIKILTYIRKTEGNLEICKLGHYGEIYPMSKYSFYVTTGYKKIYLHKTKRIVNIETPYIGPEPD